MVLSLLPVTLVAIDIAILKILEKMRKVRVFLAKIHIFEHVNIHIFDFFSIF